MITTRRRVQVTIQQMSRVFGAVKASTNEILPKNPKLFAIFVEGYLEDFDRMRRELARDLRELKGTVSGPSTKSKNRPRSRGRHRVKVG